MSRAFNRATGEGVRSRVRDVRDAGDAGHSSGARDRWLISYADLMTLLLALFVVLYAAADGERARAIASYMSAQLGDARHADGDEKTGRGLLPGGDSLAAERAAIERAFESDNGLASRARVATNERGLVVSLAEAGFFSPGEAALREDATPMIDALAEALRASNAPVRVEGHTDSTPIRTARYPSNWELSAARASVVLSLLNARGVHTSRLSVAGYAGERPFADNSTPEGRALNRRVDVVVLRAANR